MEVRALCIRLLMAIMILLGADDKKVDSVSLLVIPNRSQFFEYETVTFYCEGIVDCEVVHKFKGKIQSCRKTNKRTPTGSSCTITTVYTDDSGEYWCEAEGGKRTNSINFNVTTGSVILEIPADPVMEGQAVTLHCRNKITSSNFTAHFSKDGDHVYSSSTGEMIIQSVSNSDEGLYKCSISGAGESPESWLNVTDSRNETNLSCSAATPWMIATIVLSALLMVVGLYHFGKVCWDRALLCQSTKVDGSGSAEDQTVSTEATTVNAGGAIYAVVRKNRKKKDEDVLSSRPIYYNLGWGETQPQAEPGTIRMMPSAGVESTYSRGSL